MNNNININLLKKIVKIRSLSTDNFQCFRALETVREEISKHHIPCMINNINDVPFLVAGNLETADTLILCHIDVVPGRDELFELRSVRDKLFGRGVLDMKGPLVAALGSFVQLWKLGQRRFLFVITSDEEIGGFNGTDSLTKGVLKNIKQAIIPDSTGDELVLTQKAPFHVKLNSVGKSSHGSKPWEGINAADKLLNCCREIIKKINCDSTELTSACLSQFHSGDSTNKVPDHAMATIDIRILNKSEVDEIITILGRCSTNWKCSWEKIDEPVFFEAKITNNFIQKWISAFEKTHSKKLTTKIESGASDARFLWNDLKIPVVVSSAVGGGAHSNEEWASIDSLNQLSNTIINLGLKLQ